MNKQLAALSKFLKNKKFSNELRILTSFFKNASSGLTDGEVLFENERFKVIYESNIKNYCKYFPEEGHKNPCIERKYEWRHRPETPILEIEKDFESYSLISDPQYIGDTFLALVIDNNAPSIEMSGEGIVDLMKYYFIRIVNGVFAFSDLET